MLLTSCASLSSITGSAVSFRMKVQKEGTLWSGTNSVRTLCHHLNWVIANNRGDNISQRYFEPCLPMNQILLKIWKVPYVQTVNSHQLLLQASSFFCMKSLLQQISLPAWSFLMSARIWMINWSVHLHRVSFPALLVPAVLWDSISFSPLV